MLKHCLSLTYVINQVSGDEELLDTARDYFCFVTRFFELISVSATHIYHSALTLSPLSSIVRRTHYDQQHTPLPRVIVGTQKSWEQKITTHAKEDYSTHTWSPCGQFIAAWNEGGVRIHDSLTLELLSTLKSTESTPWYGYLLAYSTDGTSIAFLSDILLTIWDIQTGGVANEISHGSDHSVSLLWSLDGSMIGIVNKKEGNTYAVHTCHTASGAIHFHGTLQSSDKPYLWAHGTSFQILAAVETSGGCAISISEVGSSLTKIESFHVGLWEDSHIRSFAPKTHCILVGSSQCFAILDIQNSDCLLIQEGDPDSCCFSSDGRLFAARFICSIQIWKYSSGSYTPWRKFASGGSQLQFSPTLSSLSCLSNAALYLWHLDDPIIGVHPDGHKSLVALSHCGGFIAVGGSDGTVTITNLLSPTFSHIIDTGVTIEKLTLNGNILVVQDSKTIMAWRLTKEGAVVGVSADRRAGPNNTIQITSVSNPMFHIRDQILTIRGPGAEGYVCHCYCPESGKILELTHGIPLERPYKFCSHSISHGSHSISYGSHSISYGSHTISYGSHNLHTYRPDPQHNQSGHGGRIPQDLKEGWVKGSGGKHQLWLPLEWREYSQGWSYDGRALQLGGRETIIIRF